MSRAGSSIVVEERVGRLAVWSDAEKQPRRLIESAECVLGERCDVHQLAGLGDYHNTIDLELHAALQNEEDLGGTVVRVNCPVGPRVLLKEPTADLGRDDDIAEIRARVEDLYRRHCLFTDRHEVQGAPRWHQRTN